jgi:hypothetical protein
MTPDPDNPAPKISPAAPMPAIATAHRRRLRAVWRSAGWPSHDIVDAELLAAGLLERRENADGRITLRVTDAGVHELVRTAEGHRSARSVHDALVSRVAATLARDGRIAWCGLSLRAWVALPQAGDGADAVPDGRWQMAMPDVYSVRQTSVAAYLLPVVHEIKVSRADLLADLRLVAKRTAYQQMAGAFFYVLAEGVGDVDDIPPECGVILARGASKSHVAHAAEPVHLEILRNAPTRAMNEPAGLPFGIWMALARLAPQCLPDDPQLALNHEADAAPLAQQLER